MEYVIKICYGLKIIFQTEKDILNTEMIPASRNLQIYGSKNVWYKAPWFIPFFNIHK